MLRSVRGQPYVSQDGDSIVGKYNATTDVAINADFLIMGLDGPTALVLSGNNLFVANYGSGTVGEYNATTGAAINVNFISGLGYPSTLAVALPHLW
jgi:hypothetical protein